MYKTHVFTMIEKDLFDKLKVTLNEVIKDSNSLDELICDVIREAIRTRDEFEYKEID